MALINELTEIHSRFKRENTRNAGLNKRSARNNELIDIRSPKDEQFHDSVD